MVPKIKNIIIFVIIAAALVLVYFLFVKPAITDNQQGSLVSSNASTVLPDINTSGGNSPIVPSDTPLIAKDFLTLLSNSKTIKLDETIFSNSAFIGLKDSSFPLDPDPNPGRANPFAKFGSDSVAATPFPDFEVVCTLPQILDTFTNTCITPITCKAPKVLDKITNTCVTPVP